MTGISLILTAAAAAPAWGGRPNALNWSAISGVDFASTNVQTISGLNGPISVAASHTGAGLLFYALNGLFNVYSGPFTVRNGDVLAWTVETSDSRRVAGTVTVSDVSAAGGILASFAYAVASSDLRNL